MSVLADTADPVWIDIRENKDSQVFCECRNTPIGHEEKIEYQMFFF